jgi:hypothetical protein
VTDGGVDRFSGLGRLVGRVLLRVQEGKVALVRVVVQQGSVSGFLRLGMASLCRLLLRGGLIPDSSCCVLFLAYTASCMDVWQALDVRQGMQLL